MTASHNATQRKSRVLLNCFFFFFFPSFGWWLVCVEYSRAHRFERSLSVSLDICL